MPQSPSGADTPDYVHIQPTPAATTTPTTAPVPTSDNAAPASPRKTTALIRDRVIRELGHEADVRMPGRTRGETRAIRESRHSMGLMFHAALAQGIATREAFDEAFREHELPPQTLTFRLPPPATCRPRLPLPRRNHRSTLRYGVTPGHGNSAACYRPTRSAPRSNQSAMLLTQSGCSVGNQTNSVG